MSQYICHKLVCDGCKKELLIPVPPFASIRRQVELPTGWSFTGSADLCPDCVKNVNDLALQCGWHGTRIKE